MIIRESEEKELLGRQI